MGEPRGAHAEPGGHLRAALPYYESQRGALHRFLIDGRLERHNTSERQLRPLVMGRHHSQHFETKPGVGWYATFRSVIASCVLLSLGPAALRRV